MSLLEKLIKQLIMLKKQLAKKRRAIIALASAVVFFMTYVMILPATSMGTESVQAGTNIETSQVTGESNEQGSNVVTDNASVGGSQAAEAAVNKAATDNAASADGDVSEKSVKNAEPKTPIYQTGTLTSKKDGYTVTVDLDEKDQIPEGTTLSVKKIGANSDVYKRVKGLVSSARNIEENELGMDALDISLINNNEQKIEPKGEVSIKIEADDLPEEAKDISIHHIKDNNVITNANMIDGVKTLLDKNNTEEVGKAKAADGKADVEFKTESLSPFTVSWAKAMDAGEDEAGGPYSLNAHPDKVTGTTVSYIQNGTKHTIDANSTANIPEGVREFEITINYGSTIKGQGINLSDLKTNHDKQVSYTLPDFFNSASIVSEGKIMDGNIQVGTMQIVSENGVNKAVVTFNDDFFNNIDQTTTIDEATMTFRATADENKINENPVNVQIGNVSVNLNFEEKDIAYTGELNVTKGNPKYVQDTADPANVGYLEYTITINTGSDKMPKVRVEDSITTGSEYVDAYQVLIQPEDGTASYTTVPSNGTDLTVAGEGDTAEKVSMTGATPKKMTWTIGDMDANSSKTLTYRIKLNNNYVGLGDSIGNNKKLIINKATPYSKTYPHNFDTKTYEPTVQSTTSKTVGDIIDNKQNGTITIPYTITITANQSPWPIRNVKIADNLGGHGTDKRLSDADRAAICAAAVGKGLGFQNFKIFEVDEEKHEKPMAIPGRNGENPETHYESNWSYNPRFDLYIGDVPAGKSLKITYDLILSKSFLTSRSGSWSLTNEMTARTDDEKKEGIGGNTIFGSDNVKVDIGRQQWDRKIQSKATTEVVSQHPDGKEEKTVPAGSYKYQVVVNEEGQWNVSGATFKDALGVDEEHSSTSHLQYAGYLQIDYYADGINYGERGSIPSDDDAIRSLANKEPTRTVLVNIDGQQKFSINPTSLGFDNTKGAYLLTYYATPVGLSEITTLTTGNSFSLSGTIVGPGGGGNFTAGTGTYIHQDVTLHGTSKFKSEKNPWYYDSLNQKLYWVVEASGTDLQQGLILRDVTGSNNTRPTLVGAYIGNISGNEGHLNLRYRDLAAFEADKTSFTELLENIDYSVTRTGNSTLDFKISKDRAMAGDEKLYLIVSSAPNINTSNKRDAYTANNRLQIQEPGTSSFGTPKDAYLVIAKGGTNFKEMNRILQKDAGGKWSSLTNGSNTSSILQDQIKTGGIYVDWRIKVNYLADLEGLIHVTDQLPEGVEPVYARYFWIDPGIRNANAPTMPAVSGLESLAWKDIGLKNAPMDNTSDTKSAYAYYNASTRQIKFDVDNLQSRQGNIDQIKDKYSLEVQIVTKITDPEVLVGIQKIFSNTMTITDKAGIEIGRDSASTTVKETSISKEAVNQTNGLPLFTLTVNPLGEQLAGGAEKITVVDDMSDPLAFNLDSIKVMDGSTDITNQVTISDGGRNKDNNGNILLFSVPNGKKLVITYTATPQVAPYVKYSFSNKAYWQGYAQGTITKNENNWEYSLAGSASKTQLASIKVVKRDQTDMSKVLSGAEFTLQEVTFDAQTGTWKNVDSFTELKGTTDSNGAIIFGGTAQNVEYNKAYKLTETKAPDGYFLDRTSKYIVIAERTRSGNLPTYPEELTTFGDHGAVIEYNSYQYTANVSDTPMKLLLRKTDTSGKPLTGAEFLLQKHNTSTGWENVTAGGLSDGKITVNSEDGFDITGLTAGTYKIVETKAPDGYIIASAGEMMFTVTNSDISMDTSKLGGMVQFSKPTNGEITYTITVKNQAGTALPGTGGSGTMLFYILGVALAVGAGVIFLFRRRSV